MKNRGVENTIDIWNRELSGKTFSSHASTPSFIRVFLLVQSKGQYKFVYVQRNEDWRAIWRHIQGKNTHLQILDLYTPAKE